MPSSAAGLKRLLRRRHELKLLARLRAIQSSDESDLGSDEELERVRQLQKRRKTVRAAERDAQREAEAAEAVLQQKRAAAESEVCSSAGDEITVPIDSDLGDPANIALMQSMDAVESPPTEVEEHLRQQVNVGSDCGNPANANVWFESSAATIEEDMQPTHARQEDGMPGNSCSDTGVATNACLLLGSEEGEQLAPDEVNGEADVADDERILCNSDQDEGLCIESDHEADEEDQRAVDLAAEDHVADFELDCDAIVEQALHVEQDAHTARQRRQRNDEPVYGPKNLSIAKQMQLFGRELVAAFCQHDVTVAAANHINMVYKKNWQMLTRFVSETGREIPNFISHRSTCIAKLPPIKLSTAHRRMDAPADDVVIETSTNLKTYSQTYADRTKYKRLWIQCKIQV